MERLTPGTPVRWNHPSGQTYTGTVLRHDQDGIIIHNDRYPEQDTRRSLFITDADQVEVVQ